MLYNFPWKSIREYCSGGSRKILTVGVKLKESNSNKSPDSFPVKIPSFTRTELLKFEGFFLNRTDNAVIRFSASHAYSGFLGQITNEASLFSLHELS